MADRRLILLALLFVPAEAGAKDKLEPRVQSVLACSAVTATDARLRCFDGAAAALRQALADGNVVLKEKKGPRSREGIVRASGQSGESSYWVELDNGDRWTTVTKIARRGPPAPGTPMRLKRTPLGNYWISGPGWSESEATFAGHQP